jgi:sugar/nucleoside kinase (ribokinase family)
MSNFPLASPSAATLRASDALPPALLGFDGFIDTICDVVDSRQSATQYQRVKTLQAYGQRIVAAAGKSTNVEIVPTLVKLGGNGPIMANALTALSVPVTYCGMTGYPHTHPVFEEFGTRARLLPVCEPALTDAYEFDDGKLIVGKHATVAEISHENIIERVGEVAWRTAWESAGFVAMVNWTMLPYMTALWKQILTDFPASNERKTLFFDLADPEKRSATDIGEALEVIAAFQERHDVILGLNEKEAVQVGKVLNLETPLGDVLTPETATELAAAIRARLEIGTVVVHPTRFAAAANAENAACVEGPWTANPKISTGAGDHFNAGFCLGQLLGADLGQSLQIGVGTSGFYVRNAQSPSQNQLADFLDSL